MERHYTSEHMEKFIAASPDGRWEVYLADIYHSTADVVALDTSTGAMTYLSGGITMPGSAVFTSDNMLLLNKTSSLELIDVEEARVLNAEFGIDCEAKDCLINGIGYDAQSDWFLVAWRSPQQSRAEALPLTLEVYDRDGALVRSLDTGHTIRPFAQIGVVSLTLEPLGDGSVNIQGATQIDPIGNVKYD